MGVTYYRIKDLDMLAKEEDYVPYLHRPNRGWVVDNENILMDRLMGYNDSESVESPYKIGCLGVMDAVEEISEMEARKIIGTDL